MPQLAACSESVPCRRFVKDWARMKLADWFERSPRHARHRRPRELRRVFWSWPESENWPSCFENQVERFSACRSRCLCCSPLHYIRRCVSRTNEIAESTNDGIEMTHGTRWRVLVLLSVQIFDQELSIDRGRPACRARDFAPRVCPLASKNEAIT